MAKQRLDYERVELIKYLLDTNKYNHREIGELFGCQRSNITKIKKGSRWGEVPPPNERRLTYLFDKFNLIPR